MKGAPAWPALSPGAPLITTRQMAVGSLSPSSGFPVGDSWLAASDGFFEARLDLRGGPTGFRIRLKAIRQVGEWPELRLLLDGTEIGSTRLDANEPDRSNAESVMSERYRWVEVAASTVAPAGPARLRVEYTCSHFDPIERIGIRGILFDRLFVSEVPGREDGCEQGPVPAADRKVLLIGLDGASWSVLLPLVNQGLLPNLANLLAEGSYGPLDSMPPTYSPAVWNTIYTGEPRDVHGLDQMTVKRAGSYGTASHSTADLKAATLWQMATYAGRSLLVVGMNTTWPAQPVRGVLISDRAFEGEAAGAVWPPGQEGPARAALAELRSRAKELLPEDPGTKIPAGLRASAVRDAQAVAIAEAYLSHGQPDLTAVYIALPDHAGHLLWREHAPFGVEHRFKSATPRSQPGTDGLERACVLVDTLVGRLLNVVDLKKTAVVVVSDHSVDVPDPMTTRRYRLAPLLKEVAGESVYTPLREGWIVAPLYLNVIGRESSGVIDPSRIQEAREEIRRTLASLRTVTGKHVFEDVSLPSQRALSKEGYQPADLVGILNGGLDPSDSIAMENGRRFPLTEVIHDLGNRSGSHNRFGVIAMAGSGVRRGGLIPYASLIDVAPTLLALMGLPRGADMPGRPVAEALEDGIVSPCIIPSYGPLVKAAAPPAAPPSPLSEEEARRLRALGYVD